nr:hypothetical protein [Tanacetum cinerariifolium]
MKTAFFHGTLKEDVYVCQPEGFIDADHPSHFYKLKKALYGLKQAPRAWYDELSTFLLQNHFFKGTINLTLFISRFDDDILLYQAKPIVKHLKEVKRIFRYLWGTINMGLWYIKDSGFKLTGFLDADYAGCKYTFKSTSGGVQFLSKSWLAGPQRNKTLTNYGFYFEKIPIYCDSKSAIAISYNPVQHSRTKHIAVRYHFIKEHVEKGMIELYFVKTDYQLADIFTKALPVDRFNYLVRRLGKHISGGSSIKDFSLTTSPCLREVDDQDKDEDPSAGSNRGSKRRRSGKEAESSNKLTHKESGKSAYAEKHGQKVDDLEDQTHQEFNTRNDDVTHVREALDNDDSMCKSVVELEYHLEEVFKATNDKLDCHNLEGQPYTYDLSKPLPLILNEQGCQVIPLDYFINNDLKYLKGGSSSKKHTTFVTKMKAADYGQVKRSEDKDVYFRHMIIIVTSIKILKLFGYSHLEEIIVRRQDEKLYKFREGDFKRL